MATRYHDKEVAVRATLLAASIALLTTGCASIVSDKVHPVNITSSPAGAHFEIKNEDGVMVHNGVTPAVVQLPSGAGYFDGAEYFITLKKDGYQDQQVHLDSGINGWYWGNLLFGGVIGMLIVDPSTGAMYDLPKFAAGSLVQIPTPALAVTPAAPAPAVASNAGVQAPMSQPQWQAQQLQRLQSETGLSYEEYQRRYREITGN
ncbi:hypothetical protein D9M70_438790 [compost metagenome]